MVICEETLSVAIAVRFLTQMNKENQFFFPTSFTVSFTKWRRMMQRGAGGLGSI